MKKKKLSENDCCSKLSNKSKWFHSVTDGKMMDTSAAKRVTSREEELDSREGKSHLFQCENNARMFKVPKSMHQGLFIYSWFQHFTRSSNATKERKLPSFSYILVLCVFLLTLSIPVNGDKLQPETHLPPRTNDTGVCQSLDIRNSPAQLERLKNCRVIEGFLQILLIDRVKGSDKAFENYTFPLLTEITNYLMLYRVNGLKTLRKLFPNLAVIRGNQLFDNYALIVYEMLDIEEIGLTSLTHIGRGAVRIQNNPSLCYVHTIDWTLIALHTVRNDHYIKGNNKENLCPMCPGSKKHEKESDQESQKSALECPISRHDPYSRLCWNSENCQKTCPESCKNQGSLACTSDGRCCDSSCIGGCHINNITKCTVCRHFSMNYGPSQFCVSKCIPDFYEHMNRRCISRDECLNVTKSLDVKDIRSPYPYVPFKGACTLECPKNYYKMDNDTNNRTCIPCNGLCRKTCQAAKIDSISTAQQMRGCTHITGSLEIQIMNQGGLNIVKELEEFLSNIEEIDGYLKVARSFPLVSLGFLKNLKIIHGKTLEYDRNSLIVLDNPNLQSLWNRTDQLRIERGRISFHYNPKLCLYKIETLKNSITYMDGKDFYEVQDVAKTSNGDKIACNVTKLIVNTTKIRDNGAIIEWEPFQLEDDRALLGYVVSYIEAPFQNVSLYDGRDACGSDGWAVDDVGRNMDESTSISYILPRLEPYTQYAYYVKTYTVATEQLGAQSDIMYFRTRAGRPEQVQRLRTTANGTDEIVVEWDPPSKARGNLTSYCILATMSEDSEALRSKRNYCAYGLKPDSDLSGPVAIPQKPTPPGSEDPHKCACAKQDKPILSESDAESQISFEDHLHNYVYIKKTVERSRRSITYNNGNSSISFGDIIFPDNDETEDSGIPEEKKRDIMDKANDHYIQIYRELNVSDTKYVIKKLKHYTQYIISVMACREIEKNDLLDSEKETPNCSTKAIVYQRTGKIATADNIKWIGVEKSSNNTIFISWRPPVQPNSLVLTYTVRVQKMDDVNNMRKPVEHCIQKEVFDKTNGTFKLTMAEPGNYSIQVMATSLAGDGPYSQARFIIIPVRGQPEERWEWEYNDLNKVLNSSHLVNHHGRYINASVLQKS